MPPSLSYTPDKLIRYKTSTGANQEVQEIADQPRLAPKQFSEPDEAQHRETEEKKQFPVRSPPGYNIRLQRSTDFMEPILGLMTWRLPQMDTHQSQDQQDPD